MNPSEAGKYAAAPQLTSAECGGCEGIPQALLAGDVEKRMMCDGILWDWFGLWMRVKYSHPSVYNTLLPANISRLFIEPIRSRQGKVSGVDLFSFLASIKRI